VDLEQVVPAAFWSRTMAATAAGDVAELPLNDGPEVSRRGPSSRPAATLSRSARCIGAPSMPARGRHAGEHVQRQRAVGVHGLRAARHVRMELGDGGHEELAARVDRRRPRGRGPPAAHVRDASVLDDHRLIREDGLAVHRDHRHAREHHGGLLRRRGGGHADGGEEQTDSDGWTEHRALQGG
jgi:hypothetical protein